MSQLYINLLLILFHIRCLKPSKQQQLDALCKSLTEILWKIGENEKVIICLPQEKSYVPHSLNYFQDNITEKVRRLHKEIKIKLYY